MLPNHPCTYAYVLNNPLTLTDPSGYLSTYGEYLKSQNSHAGGYFYYRGDFYSKSDDRPGFDIYGGIGGGCIGYEGGATYYNNATGQAFVNGESVSGHEYVRSVAVPLPEHMVNDVRSHIAQQQQIMASFSSAGASVEIGQFRGFDKHFFGYSASTGQFYIPWTNTTINPLDVLSGKIDWYGMFESSLGELYSSLPAYTNSTPYDPPFPPDNTIETLLIPVPPIFKAMKAAKISKGGARVLNANPFKGKSFRQIDKMFKAKGFTTKGPSPMTGRGSYFNPNSGTRYYLDQGRMYRNGFESPHVDIWYNGHPTYEKVKYFLDDLSKIYTPIK